MELREQYTPRPLETSAAEVLESLPAFMETSGGTTLLDVLVQRMSVNSPVLDIGCGRGTVMYSLVKEGKAVTGIDIDPTVIHEGARKLAKQRADQWRIVEGDATQIDFPKDIVTAVSFETLGVLPDEKVTTILSKLRDAECKKLIVVGWDPELMKIQAEAIYKEIELLTKYSERPEDHEMTGMLHSAIRDFVLDGRDFKPGTKIRKIAERLLELDPYTDYSFMEFAEKNNFYPRTVKKVLALVRRRTESFDYCKSYPSDAEHRVLEIEDGRFRFNLRPVANQFAAVLSNSPLLRFREEYVGERLGGRFHTGREMETVLTSCGASVVQSLVLSNLIPPEYLPLRVVIQGFFMPSAAGSRGPVRTTEGTQWVQRPLTHLANLKEWQKQRFTRANHLDVLSGSERFQDSSELGRLLGCLYYIEVEI